MGKIIISKNDEVVNTFETVEFDKKEIKIFDHLNNCLPIEMNIEKNEDYTLIINETLKSKVKILVEGLSDKIIFEKYIKSKNLDHYCDVLASSGIAKTQKIVEDILKENSNHQVIVIWDGDHHNTSSLITQLEQKLIFAKYSQKYDNVQVVTLKNNCLEEYYRDIEFPIELSSKVEKANFVVNHLELCKYVFNQFELEDVLCIDKINKFIEQTENKNKKLIFNDFSVPIAANINWVSFNVLEKEFKLDKNVIYLSFELIKHEKEGNIKSSKKSIHKKMGDNPKLHVPKHEFREPEKKLRILIPNKSLRQLILSHVELLDGVEDYQLEHNNLSTQIKSILNGSEIVILCHSQELYNEMNKLTNISKNIKVIDIRKYYPQNSMPSNLSDKSKVEFLGKHSNMQAYFKKQLKANKVLKKYFK